MALESEFRARTKVEIFREAGHRCANPDCKAHLYSYDRISERTTTLGEACHIYPAREGGPRYDFFNSDPEYLSSVKNGICLCFDCHKKVDYNPERYTADELFKWKREAQRNNQPDRNRLMPLLGPGRTMGSEIRELEIYIQDKRESMLNLRDFIQEISRLSFFEDIRIGRNVYYDVSHVAGVSISSKRYELTHEGIINEVRFLSSLAADILNKLSIEQIFRGGVRTIRDYNDKDRYGRYRETHVYNDGIAERINQLLLTYRELENYCDDLSGEIFIR